MSNRVARPGTVWATQGLLLLFALIWFFSLTSSLVMIARDGSNASPLRILVGVSILGSVVVLFLVAFWGLAKRRIYGKWLGVASLSLLGVAIVYTQVRPPQGPLRQFEYNSPAQVVGAVIAGVFIGVLFLILIFRLAFSKSVDRFFSQRQPSDEDYSAPAA
jgi:hypothetical protein